MHDSVQRHETSELFTRERRTIVCYNLMRESVRRKDDSELFEWLGGCNCTHDAHL